MRPRWWHIHVYHDVGVIPIDDKQHGVLRRCRCLASQILRRWTL